MFICNLKFLYVGINSYDHELRYIMTSYFRIEDVFQRPYPIVFLFFPIIYSIGSVICIGTTGILIFKSNNYPSEYFICFPSDFAV